MASLTFLEVDQEDRMTITQRFPDATIIDKALEGDALVNACADAEMICCFINSRFSRETLLRLPALKLLITRSVGFDHIDIDACKERGIMLCNVPDYGSHVIAEHVFALLLSTIRHIPEANTKVESGAFDYHGLRGMALSGKTLGIVGTGKIGRKVAAIAHGFGMKILAVDQCRTQELCDELGVRYVLLPELLAQSDIITLHVPDLPDTRHMINAASLATMKDGVIVVNTARGSLIDSSALLGALQRGKVGYALLDVLEHEHNFAENKALISHPQVIATPHIAFYADDSMKNMYSDAFASIDEWLSGARPQHAVRPLKIVCDVPGVRKSGK